MSTKAELKDPRLEVVDRMCMAELEQHLRVRAAMISDDIAKRYTGRNTWMRQAKYAETLHAEGAAKIARWYQKRDHYVMWKRLIWQAFDEILAERNLP